MKKIFITLFSILASVASVFTFNSYAQAHFLATDRSIGAELHIEPDDNPIVNQTATFFFDVNDKMNKFQPTQCRCRVVIKENGRQLDSKSLSQADLSISTLSYIFPKKDVYQVQLVGSPIQSGAFQPFTLTWDVRVDRDNGHGGAVSSSPFVHFVQRYIPPIVLIFLAILGIRYQLLGGKQIKRGK